MQIIKRDQKIIKNQQSQRMIKIVIYKSLF